MSNKSFEELKDEYIECAKITQDIDYADKKSVKISNKAVDRMIQISKYISTRYSLRIRDFAALLDINNYMIDIWVAHHILENMNYLPELESKALDVIAKYSKQDFIEGLGNRMWLEQWKKKRQAVDTEWTE